MNDTNDSTEPMPTVPDGYEQRVDDGRDETLLMHKGAELPFPVITVNELLFLVINANDYAVKFKFDNVRSCCPDARVFDTECDHFRALQTYMDDILKTWATKTSDTPAMRSIDEPMQLWCI